MKKYIAIAFMLVFKYSYEQYPNIEQVVENNIETYSVYLTEYYNQNPSQEVHLIKMLYDKKGNKIDSTFAFDNGYLDGAVTWHYDSITNNLEKIKHYNYLNYSDSWYVNEIYTYKYDSVGNMIEESRNDERNSFSEYYIAYSYDTLGRRFTRNKDNSYLQYYYYDPQNRIIQITKVKYKKNKRGKNYIVQNNDCTGMDHLRLPEVEYEYFLDSTIEIKTRWSGNSKTIFTSKNQKIYYYYYYYTAGSRSHYQTIKYQYNKYDKLIKELIWDTKDTSLVNLYEEIKYIYDDKGNLASKSNYFKQSNNLELEVYQYDDNNLLNKITCYRNFKKEKEYRIDYKYFY